MKVIRCGNSIVFSFRFMTISKYGNQIPLVNQWDRLTDFVGICVLSLCAVSMVWRRWPQCFATRWPDTLECHHSWQKCLGTTATAVTAAMRIRIYAIDCGDLYRLHRALVHILYQKMARQGLLVVGCTEVWQGMMLLNDVSYVQQIENCIRNNVCVVIRYFIPKQPT